MQDQKWAQALAGGGVNGITGTGVGAFAGGMIPAMGGPLAGASLAAAGGVASAITGIVSTGIQTAFDKQNFELGLKSKSMCLDQLYGNTSSSDQLNNSRDGIYWIIKTSNNSTMMLNEYYRKGYPTLYNTTIGTLEYLANPLFGSKDCKIVSGYLLETIENNWITNEINKKLAEGVIILV